MVARNEQLLFGWMTRTQCIHHQRRPAQSSHFKIVQYCRLSPTIVQYNAPQQKQMTSVVPALEMTTFQPAKSGGKSQLTQASCQ